ncbi:hypothetical protein [Candidatus Liberibacter sp.]|uniref:hypothetical protein n=1 Tax=Candidatus Liberibacter sp. TaxID=34022 RepID=UPI0015F63524|nr:hypothetical protein [Candidatus Liberibacter sp.]MBA5724081.1 hypothetical protein [Candidatus Liberibacter sp.]
MKDVNTIVCTDYFDKNIIFCNQRQDNSDSTQEKKKDDFRDFLKKIPEKEVINSQLSHDVFSLSKNVDLTVPRLFKDVSNSDGLEGFFSQDELATANMQDWDRNNKEDKDALVDVSGIIAICDNGNLDGRDFIAQDFSVMLEKIISKDNLTKETVSDLLPDSFSSVNPINSDVFESHSKNTCFGSTDFLKDDLKDMIPNSRSIQEKNQGTRVINSRVFASQQDGVSASENGLITHKTLALSETSDVPQTACPYDSEVFFKEIVDDMNQQPSIRLISSLEYTNYAKKEQINSLKIQMKPDSPENVIATLRLSGSKLSIRLQVEASCLYNRIQYDRQVILDTLQFPGYTIDCFDVAFIMQDVADFYPNTIDFHTQQKNFQQSEDSGKNKQQDFERWRADKKNFSEEENRWDIYNDRGGTSACADCVYI